MWLESTYLPCLAYLQCITQTVQSKTKYHKKRANKPTTPQKSQKHQTTKKNPKKTKTKKSPKQTKNPNNKTKPNQNQPTNQTTYSNSKINLHINAFKIALVTSWSFLSSSQAVCFCYLGQVNNFSILLHFWYAPVIFSVRLDRTAVQRNGPPLNQTRRYFFSLKTQKDI